MLRLSKLGLFPFSQSQNFIPMTVSCPSLATNMQKPMMYCPFPTHDDALFYMLSAMNGAKGE